MEEAGDFLEQDEDGEMGDDYVPDIASVFKVKQLALNMEQIRQYNPPENPAKITDPRAKGYIAKYGNKSWELDALRPQVLAELCRKGIEEEIDVDLFEETCDKEKKQKTAITKFMEEYQPIYHFE